MGTKNLVLDIGEDKSAADLQARLDKASEDGFFLVNVVGRFAFLRTTVSQTQKSLPVVTETDTPVKEDERCRDIIKQLVTKDPEMGVNRIQIELRQRTGNGRGAAWVNDQKSRILGCGSTVAEG